VDANDNAQKFFGLELSRLQEVGPVTLSPSQQPDGASSEERAHAYIQRALAGDVPVFEWAHYDTGGREIVCEVRLVRLPSGNRRLVRGSIADISERKRAERMSAAEHRVFEQVTRNAPLPEVLASITRFIESAGVGMISSASVLAEHRKAFSHMVAPHLPDALRTALGRATVDARNGSCVAAVYLDRQVLVADVTKDPFWADRSMWRWRRACVRPGRPRSRLPRDMCSARSGFTGPSPGCRLRRSRRSWHAALSLPASPLSGASPKRPCAAARRSFAACSRVSPRACIKAGAMAGCCR
jgi:PAS domain S-box-containing protein